LIGNWESFISKLKYQFRKEIQEEQEEIQRLREADYQFRKVIQEVKEMQEEEEVQQQILRRQIDEELRQAMEKLCEWFSKGNNGVVNLQGVAQEDAIEIPNSLKSNDQPLVMNFLVFGFCLCIL
jgi:seryl-tRNA synthetase